MTEGQRNEQRRRQSKAKRRRMSISLKVAGGLFCVSLGVGVSNSGGCRFKTRRRGV